LYDKHIAYLSGKKKEIIADSKIAKEEFIKNGL
jgi:hypothetical protein